MGVFLVFDIFSQVFLQLQGLNYRSIILIIEFEGGRVYWSYEDNDKVWEQFILGFLIFFIL